MTITLGVVVLMLSLLGWLGQLLSATAPRLAAGLGLTEPESGVDRTFLADVHAEAVWDALSLWTLPLAATLFILNEPTWSIFGLVGGSTFLYFAGRGIAQRIVMQRRCIRVGEPSTVKVFYVFLTLWGAIGAVMILAAGLELHGRM